MTRAGKYAPLADWFSRQTTDTLTLTFAQIERIIDAELPRSAHEYDAWWRDASRNTSHVHALAWLENGWRVDLLNRKAQSVSFRRVG